MRVQEHLANLTRHIDLVRDACKLLGNRLIENGQEDLGIQLIARGYKHDASKFTGIEWDYLHNGKDTPKDSLALAIEHHQLTNDHHPEHWGTIEQMPEVCLAEMVCDWYARAQEFGTDFREWYLDKAMARYKIKEGSYEDETIQGFLDLLLVNYFK